ncbi:MAG: D-alanine--D-alanine ligase [Coriobacteriia bacterium]|nr:D-alanine--D-alanine ligase [Coriobacteriia bacterium]
MPIEPAAAAFFESSLANPCRRIALLAGGRFSEREVSLASGSSAHAALDAYGHTVRDFDPAAADFAQQLKDWAPEVVFIALHGRDGENGGIQGFLETLGLAYTGSGVLASALAMDKEKSKLFYQHIGLSTPASCTVTNDQMLQGCEQQIISTLGLPCVIKPVDEGSSVNVAIVRDEPGLRPALSHALSLNSRLLVEKYIIGTEVTASVVSGYDDALLALPVIEIVPTAEFYDYRSKYAQGGSEHFCPARLPAVVLERCQEAAKQAHRVLGCSGASRSDFIVSPDGTPWIIETNTIPGMTQTSLLPQAAEHMGISADLLYTHLVETAIQKNNRRQKNNDF